MIATIVAHLFAGIFLANGVPHFVNGISGNPFQTPFASPPAVGEASSIVNVLWGTANFVIGLWLLVGVSEFRLGLNPDTIAVFAGALLIALTLAWHFGRVRER